MNGLLNDMKNIIMVLGIGINERGWAGLVSKHGRVTLIQLGLVEHVEVWEDGRRTYCGPEVKVGHWLRVLDEVLLGAIGFFRTRQLIFQNLQGSPADVVLTAFYGSGLAAAFLQKTGRARRTVSFLADFLPPQGSLLKRLHRRVTGWLTRLAAKWADEAWALSPRIQNALVNPRHFVVPIPVGHFPAPSVPREEIGYIGYPSPDHALDVLFDICRRHNFRLNVIGDSPYLESIKHLAPPQTVFHGLLNDEVRIGEILARCFCGYAIYRNTSPSSYSYYGFPSKTLYCFASNTPVIITNVAYFNQNFEKRGVGRVVPPEPPAIESAILELKKNYAAYSQAIDRFRVEWNAGVEEFHRQRLTELLKNNL
jgi:glycosyltransferase involved in cell wall biosynthesis